MAHVHVHLPALAALLGLHQREVPLYPCLQITWSVDDSSGCQPTLRIELRSTIQHACRRSSAQDGIILSRRHCVTNTIMHGRSQRQRCTPRQGSTTRGTMWMVLIRQQHTIIMNAHLLFVLHLHSVSGVESSQTFAVYYSKLKSRYMHSLRI